MSLILDALRKLDREKAFIRKVTANIADEILKADPVGPRKRFPRYFAALLLTVCITAGLTYVVIANLGFLAKTTTPPDPSSRGATRPPAESPPLSQTQVKEPREEGSPLSLKELPTAVRQSSQETEPALVRKPDVVAQANQRVESAPPLPAREPGDPERRLPQSSKDQVPAESKTTMESKPAPALKPSPVKQPEQRMEISPPSQETTRQVQASPSSLPAKDPDLADKRQAPPLPVEKKGAQNIAPEEARTGSPVAKNVPETSPRKADVSSSTLRLTGIVWSEDPSGRRAVINGAIITEGGVIQGAKVVEILPNRVRLVQDGRSFEIQLF